MQLWNDYEGTTLAGQWTLGRLLRTEGRSALFATTGSDGKPAVLRLTEALNDQTVLQARYRAIQAAGDRFLIKVEGYGDAELDGTPLSYAVLEPTQESLAEILAGRRLGADEALEVATVVAGGLHALHGQGLVHGLVEPESVLAAGDRIKLRSDCARPAPAPEDAQLEGAITPQTDAFGLAGIIYRSLTGNRLHDSSDALALPEPFAAIVRNTARGAWGVPEIEAELLRSNRAPATPPPPAAAASVPTSVPASALASVSASAPAPAKKATSSPARAPAAVSIWEAETQENAAAVGAAQPLSSRAPRQTPQHEETAWGPPEHVANASRRGIYLGVGAAVLLLILFLVFHHSAKKTAKQTTTAPAITAPTTPAPAPVGEQAAAAPNAVTLAPNTPTNTLPPGTKIWRVIAYTYDRQDVAARKAASLDHRFPKFNAQVWSKTGGRPFLVTLGGPMLKQQAVELRALARHAGVAPDVYAQNYSR
jgi:hypothetical protein